MWHAGGKKYMRPDMDDEFLDYGDDYDDEDEDYGS